MNLSTGLDPKREFSRSIEHKTKDIFKLMLSLVYRS